MLNQEIFENWVNQVSLIDYKARHEFKQAGEIPEFVMQDESVKALNPLNNKIHLSDPQLKHALRTIKSQHHAALSIEIIAQLPNKLKNAQWFYDAKHQNLLAVFDIAEENKIGKAIISINFTKKKDSYNAIVTSGIIPTRTLGMDIYREIKQTP